MIKMCGARFACLCLEDFLCYVADYMSMVTLPPLNDDASEHGHPLGNLEARSLPFSSYVFLIGGIMCIMSWAACVAMGASFMFYFLQDRTQL